MSINTGLILIWAVVGVLIATAIAALNSGSAPLIWLGVALMLAVLGGVGNWMFLAWRATKKKFLSE